MRTKFAKKEVSVPHFIPVDPKYPNGPRYAVCTVSKDGIPDKTLAGKDLCPWCNKIAQMKGEHALVEFPVELWEMRNAKTFKKFLGCSRYPKCDYTRNLP